MIQGRGRAPGSPADLVKAIVDTEPPRPSDVVADVRARRLVRGDLDTIVGRTLKKNPAERYVPVTALADDLRRYLGTSRSARDLTRSR